MSIYILFLKLSSNLCQLQSSSRCSQFQIVMSKTNRRQQVNGLIVGAFDIGHIFLKKKTNNSTYMLLLHQNRALWIIVLEANQAQPLTTECAGNKQHCAGNSKMRNGKKRHYKNTGKQTGLWRGNILDQVF